MHYTCTNINGVGSSLLQSNYEAIVTAIRSDVTAITNKAYSSRLISETVHHRMLTTGITDTNKASELVAAVRDRVKLHPKSFHVFMDILREEPVYAPLVNRIESTRVSTQTLISARPHSQKDDYIVLFGSLMLLAVLLYVCMLCITFYAKYCICM